MGELELAMVPQPLEVRQEMAMQGQMQRFELVPNIRDLEPKFCHCEQAKCDMTLPELRDSQEDKMVYILNYSGTYCFQHIPGEEFLAGFLSPAFLLY